MSREQRRRGVLESLDRILNRGGDADDVLRAAVDALAPLYDFVALRFVEAGRLLEGPSTGERATEATTTAVVRFEGSEVARLEVSPAPEEDAAFLERVTTLISAHCLVGWDTGGEPWEP